MDEDIIVDAKWKALKPEETTAGVEQSDVYQMLAYERAYRARRLVLIYPWFKGVQNPGICKRWHVPETWTAFEILTVDIGTPRCVSSLLQETFAEPSQNCGSPESEPVPALGKRTSRVERDGQSLRVLSVHLKSGCWGADQDDNASAASNTPPYGFVRVENRFDESGSVEITAIDDARERFGPVSLEIDAGEVAAFTSRHLEEGSAERGLSAGVGDGEGHWRLELDTDLEIAAQAYARNPEDYVSRIDATVAGTYEAGMHHYEGGVLQPGKQCREAQRLALGQPRRRRRRGHD